MDGWVSGWVGEGWMSCSYPSPPDHLQWLGGGATHNEGEDMLSDHIPATGQNEVLNCSL